MVNTLWYIQKFDDLRKNVLFWIFLRLSVRIHEYFSVRIRANHTCGIQSWDCTISFYMVQCSARAPTIKMLLFSQWTMEILFMFQWNFQLCKNVWPPNFQHTPHTIERNTKYHEIISSLGNIEMYLFKNHMSLGKIALPFSNTLFDFILFFILFYFFHSLLLVLWPTSRDFFHLWTVNRCLASFS